MTERLAWVESPLQLVAAAELAAVAGAAGHPPITVAYRISSDQMWRTAEALRERGARFARAIPYVGIPWALLAEHDEWIVGDPFSGQFRLALATLGAVGRGPRRLTVVDDGDMTVHLAEVLLGRADFARRGQTETGLKPLLGAIAHRRLATLAARERLDIATAFDDDPALRALAATGVPVTACDFAFLRGTAPGGSTAPVALPHPRILLGSAEVVDGARTPQEYRAWVARTAREAPLSYLPHRRQSDAELTALADLPGVAVVRTGLPVELVLAGRTGPIEVIASRSSAVRTLARVLDGTGSRIRSTTPTGAPA